MKRVNRLSEGRKPAIMAIVLVSLVLVSFDPGQAGAANHSARAVNSSNLVTFRLRVSSSPTAGTTFWLAYGPLAGHFGLLPLHYSGPGLYVARTHLPPGRTTFVYLAGQGTILTRFGWAPGNPVLIIGELGPIATTRAHLPSEHWLVPVG